MSASRPVVHAEALHKRFGDTHALRGLDLSVEEGTILAVLGPNGAGKTTAVRILTTLMRPDSGSAHVAGFDVLTHPDEVRRRIGVTGQYAALDELLTGFENLEMIGRLYGQSGKAARARAGELLERFDLVDAGSKLVKTYSGGMRRRLDLGASLIANPPVLFLDEPTTGLDPRSRLSMWELIAELVAGGTTLLLTTQYLEEADRLATRIVVIDHGRVIAGGTAAELKSTIGGEHLEVVISAGGDIPLARRILSTIGTGQATVSEDDRRIVVPVAVEPGLMTRVVTRLNDEGIRLDDAALTRPTLDDVFLNLTGHSTVEVGESITSEAA